ncbi:aminotransferase class III-fold pyridoxal phosphate-dependent enzyme [Acanthopleuribacter pedis]|uniref:Aminotransferase class III-fold pyridoxal phosphate-dependent enzyme n=1 Tax=Acanthopleuribacter pedis TaxID=442870 RepID=A0A8J7QB81_9BACT|nr:aminotransferase class III-fold pyridoxal phosphate-dependent enzyme [Acanthopleuribacter pedis]MBO1320880.1 aminotransferase class III-fold pyridoxal phosphate-dependent enzyme [Acanthopleuribacter pedis]
MLPYQIAAAVVVVYLVYRVHIRLRLSRAKHPSLRGHAKMSRRMAKLVPFFEYDAARFFRCDDAPAAVADQRKQAFHRLADTFRRKAPKTLAVSERLEAGISDVFFTNHYRVPFPFRNYVRNHLKIGHLVAASEGTRVRDLDGNWSHDLTGSYGVNLFGYDFYKECMQEGYEMVKDLGPVLGKYHPVIADNVKRLKEISGLDEVSFHMSGTEAVMQAVRLARYHTGRPRLVRFCGAYHGWWDGVQPGVGNVRGNHDVYTLKDMDADTLWVLRTRKDIACVLVNPLQALHPNANAPGDAMLINSNRKAAYDGEAYAAWLRELRAVCTERGIVLIFDEVFVGFRLAYRGAQEFFGVNADMVTYGKTLGGGYPVGVVCGKAHLMKRFRENRPTDLCFARGTFNAHPVVMGAMNAFLRKVSAPERLAAYTGIEAFWNARVAKLNTLLADANIPVRVANLVSIWTITYTRPSRYNWMFQYYLRAEGLSLSWVGSGRIIMSHNFSDAAFDAVCAQFVAAAKAMDGDGWWWQSETLTDKAIKRGFMKDMLRARFSFQKAGAAPSTGMEPQRNKP